MQPRRQFLVTLDIRVDDGLPEPGYMQIYRQLRAMILNGQLPAGARLMSSRSYAKHIGRSRNTIAAAYDLLVAEGLIESRHGSGTFVAQMPMDYSRNFVAEGPAAHTASGADQQAVNMAPLSSFGKRIVSTADWPIGGGRQFDGDGPDHGQFPFNEWGRLLRRTWQRPSQRVMFDTDPAGFRPLREQIALQISAQRAVRCTPDDILLTSGSLHGIDMTARMLLEVGDRVLYEEPGYIRGRNLLVALGAEIVPVPVDDEGIRLAEGLGRAPNARLAFVTPSRQSPTGVVMSIDRRRALVEWARSNDAWIFEDDYDSEFRLDAAPLKSIQSMCSDRVIYAGSLSKIMFPGLRVGYLILPPGLQPLFARARRMMDMFPSTIPQAPLARFLDEGLFAAHVNRMRRTYAERRTLLLDGLHRHLSEFLQFNNEQGGIDVCTHLRGDAWPSGSDEAISQAVEAVGMRLYPLSMYYYAEPVRQGLVFGLSILDERRLERDLQRLKDIFALHLGSATRDVRSVNPLSDPG